MLCLPWDDRGAYERPQPHPAAVHARDATDPAAHERREGRTRRSERERPLHSRSERRTGYPAGKRPSRRWLPPRAPDRRSWSWWLPVSFYPRRLSPGATLLTLPIEQERRSAPTSEPGSAVRGQQLWRRRSRRPPAVRTSAAKPSAAAWRCPRYPCRGTSRWISRSAPWGLRRPRGVSSRRRCSAGCPHAGNEGGTAGDPRSGRSWQGGRGTTSSASCAEWPLARARWSGAGERRSEGQAWGTGSEWWTGCGSRRGLT